MKARCMTALVLVSCLGIMVLLTGCFATSDARARTEEAMAVFDVDYNGRVIRDLRYGEQSRNVYDLYLPEDLENGNAGHLILFIHGGSWMGGGKGEGRPYCRNFSAHGYVSASINYTLMKDGFQPNILSINDEVLAAVSAIKEECRGLGIDLVDMAVSGFSAGACQAMMFGFRDARNSALPVRFIVQMSGPTSFEPAIWRSREVHWYLKRQTGLDGSSAGDAAWLSGFSGKAVTSAMVESGEAAGICREISPYSYIDGDSVPILSVYGALDGVVPPVSRVILEEALKAAGKEEGKPNGFDTVVMEHSGHALACDIDAQHRFLKLIYDYCDNYFVD